jgi:hypothetical protein
MAASAESACGHGRLRIDDHCFESALVADGYGCTPTSRIPSIHHDIQYELQQAGPVHLAVFDAQGRVVLGCARHGQGAGPHQYLWDGRVRSRTLMPSGVYFCRLRPDHRRCTTHGVGAVSWIGATAMRMRQRIGRSGARVLRHSLYCCIMLMMLASLASTANFCSIIALLRGTAF